MKLSPNQLRENLRIHLAELESLESVFCNPGELKIEDICTLADVKDFVDDKTTIPPPYLDLTINLYIDNMKFELCATLPHKYPYSQPEIFVRNDKLNREQHVKINKDLNEFVAGQEKGEPCIFSATCWLKDHADEYLQIEQEQPSKKEERNEKFVRYWIYSHHIYSKTKRREILELAQELKVTGFCMPGKPGLICVEGSYSDVSEWWQTIKSMNWKKIFCKIVEDDKEEAGGNFLKFNNFEEVAFQSNGVKCNHMDMGELYKFMKAHDLGYIFKEIFVETKSSGE
ncbi:RWD domain-containing protein 2A isoform X2 [Diorhabda carinulata]|nr:RWD domain-containing protein 2A isoform X2 [Diorhabda carinulata]XP_057653866.1 RWD domain-containing protein 2A isoform X2 [Diorhabda carinulata]XP_057653867.1 RWD domain-containing protein 2A isoform X2 [Diorhabda carinulata]